MHVYLILILQNITLPVRKMRLSIACCKQNCCQSCCNPQVCHDFDLGLDSRSRLLFLADCSCGPATVGPFYIYPASHSTSYTGVVGHVPNQHHTSECPVCFLKIRFMDSISISLSAGLYPACSLVPRPPHSFCRLQYEKRVPRLSPFFGESLGTRLPSLGMRLIKCYSLL